MWKLKRGDPAIGAASFALWLMPRDRRLALVDYESHIDERVFRVGVANVALFDDLRLGDVERLAVCREELISVLVEILLYLLLHTLFVDAFSSEWIRNLQEELVRFGSCDDLSRTLTDHNELAAIQRSQRDLRLSRSVRGTSGGRCREVSCGEADGDAREGEK